MRSRLLAIFVVFVSTAAADAQNAPKKQPAIINPPPTAQDYADLAKLPDWSGVWNPKISDQDQQARNNPPPRKSRRCGPRKGRPSETDLLRLLPRGASVLDAGHSQRDGNPVYPRPSDDARRIRRQPAAPHLHRRSAASRDAGPVFSWPLDRPMGGRHARRRYRRHPAAGAARDQRGGRRAE